MCQRTFHTREVEGGQVLIKHWAIDHVGDIHPAEHLTRKLLGLHDVFDKVHDAVRRASSKHDKPDGGAVREHSSRRGSRRVSHKQHKRAAPARKPKQVHFDAPAGASRRVVKSSLPPL